LLEPIDDTKVNGTTTGELKELGTTTELGIYTNDETGIVVITELGKD
jgi:hypothetical protein